MKKFFALLLCLCLAFSLSSASAATFSELQEMLRTGDSDTADQAQNTTPSGDGTQITCSAKDGLTILDANCILDTEDYSSYIDCYVYAEIRNDGSSPIAVEGNIVVTDAEGNALEEQSYVFANPDVLAPGECAFLAEYMLVEKTSSVSQPSQVAGVALSVYADPYAYSTDAPARAKVSAECVRDLNDYGIEADLVRFIITNDTGAPLRNPTVAAALYDTEGRLVLTVEGNTGFDTVILPEGGSLIIECELYSYVTDYLAQSGRSLASVYALVYGD